MPRRRRSSNTTTPPPAIKTAPIKLDAGLAVAYEWMAVDRSLGLRLASDWFVTNTAKLLKKHPPTAEGQAQYAKAIKAKGLGDNTGATEGERATAWQMAVRLYERVFAGAGLPTLAAAEKAATEPPSRRVQNVKTVLDNLNAAFGPMGVRYQPRATDERDFSEGTMWVPQEELEQMVAQAPLKLALTEAATVAQVLSVRTVNGVQNVDAAAFFANMPLILSGIYGWAETSQNGGSLIKPVGRVAAPKAGPKVSTVTGAPKAPRQSYGKLANTATIHIISRGATLKGKRLARFNAIRNGMTVAEFKAACASDPALRGNDVPFYLRGLEAEGIISL